MNKIKITISLRKIQDWVLYLFSFSLIFEYWEAFGLIKYLSVGALTGYLYLFSTLANKKIRYNKKEVRNYSIPIVIFFILLTIMSLLNYESVSKISWFNMSIFQCIILFILITIHLSNREPQVAKNALTSYSLGALLLVILSNFGLGMNYSYDMRLTLFGNPPNGLGFMIAIAIIIILSLVFENKNNYNKTRFLFLIPIPFMLKLIAETASRGAFVTLSIGLLFFIIFINMKKIYKIYFSVISLLSAILIVIFMLQSDVLRTRLLLTLTTGDISERSEIFTNFSMLFENPIFGVGETGYYRIANKVLKRFQAPHNVFIELLIYTGIVGFILYSLFLYQILQRVIHTYKYQQYLLPGILFLMTLMLFLNGQGLFIKLVWLIFAVNLGPKKSFTDA